MGKRRKRAQVTNWSAVEFDVGRFDASRPNTGSHHMHLPDHVRTKCPPKYASCTGLVSGTIGEAERSQRAEEAKGWAEREAWRLLWSRG